MKEPKKNTPSKDMNPHKERREEGQKSPKPNIGMQKTMRKPQSRGK